MRTWDGLSLLFIGFWAWKARYSDLGWHWRIYPREKESENSGARQNDIRYEGNFAMAFWQNAHFFSTFRSRPTAHMACCVFIARFFFLFHLMYHYSTVALTHTTASAVRVFKICSCVVQTRPTLSSGHLPSSSCFRQLLSRSIKLDHLQDRTVLIGRSVFGFFWLSGSWLAYKCPFQVITGIFTTLHVKVVVHVQNV